LPGLSISSWLDRHYGR